VSGLASPRHPLIDNALADARRWCAGQVIDDQPALAHAARVAMTLGDHVADPAPDLIAAALLHDSPRVRARRHRPGRRTRPQARLSHMSVERDELIRLVPQALAEMRRQIRAARQHTWPPDFFASAPGDGVSIARPSPFHRCPAPACQGTDPVTLKETG
jgi:hypothetical protein